MKTKAVFKILREHLEPVLTPLKFGPLKDSTGQNLAWSRPAGGRKHETVWCQIDKWPWDQWIGSKFTVEFQHAGTRDIGAMRGKRARIGDLLNAREKREISEYQNRVIARCRVPSPAEFRASYAMDVSEDDPALAVYREACTPVKYSGRKHYDIWLRIMDADDIVLWGEYLARWIPGALTRFAALQGEEYLW